MNRFRVSREQAADRLGYACTRIAMRLEFVVAATGMQDGRSIRSVDAAAAARPAAHARRAAARVSACSVRNALCCGASTARSGPMAAGIPGGSRCPYPTRSRGAPVGARPCAVGGALVRRQCLVRGGLIMSRQVAWPRARGTSGGARCEPEVPLPCVVNAVLAAAHPGRINKTRSRLESIGESTGRMRSRKGKSMCALTVPRPDESRYRRGGASGSPARLAGRRAGDADRPASLH